jgi:hypothetical protein
VEIRFSFWWVWGTNGAGEMIERHVFADSASEAKHRFYAQTGIVADGATAG